MNVKDAIEQRRSVKHYDSDHVMTKEEIDQILNLAILSPTAFNIQNWRFVVVSDKDLRKFRIFYCQQLIAITKTKAKFNGMRQCVRVGSLHRH